MSDQIEKATLGGGCFWCLEAVYQDLEGVEKVVSGYAGGHIPNPTYEQVCGKQTGHAEVVQISYNPDVVSYDELLDIFWTVHDPTTKDRQGNDVGPQYRSIILTHDDAQRAAAKKAIAELDQSDVWSRPIVTEVEPLTTFYAAEDHHQNYFKNNPYSGYCMVVINPKVKKFRKNYAERLKASAA